MNFIAMEDFKKLEELSHNAYEYVIVKSGKGGSEDIGYCNSSDNPVELVRRLNAIDDLNFYLFTLNDNYSPNDAMEFASRLIQLSKNTTSSLFSSLSVNDFGQAVSSF
jgi:hypothetical protein